MTHRGVTIGPSYQLRTWRGRRTAQVYGELGQGNLAQRVLDQSAADAAISAVAPSPTLTTPADARLLRGAGRSASDDYWNRRTSFNFGMRTEIPTALAERGRHMTCGALRFTAEYGSAPGGRKACWSRRYLPVTRSSARLRPCWNTAIQHDGEHTMVKLCAKHPRVAI